MKEERCKICGAVVKLLANDDRIRICYETGHLTEYQIIEKQRRRKLREKNAM